MIRLLIILSLLAIGKLLGQEVIIPQLINVQLSSPPDPLNYRTRSIIFIVPDENWQIEANQAERLQNPMQRAAYIERFTPTQSVSGLDRPSQAVREDTSNRRFLTQKADKMNRPPADELSANTSVGNTRRNPSDTFHQANLEKNEPKPISNLKQPPKVPETNKNATNQKPIPPINMTTGISPANETSSQPVDKNVTKVIVDERSSFDGDKCPTGFVKVNGKCVEAD